MRGSRLRQNAQAPWLEGELESLYSHLDGQEVLCLVLKTCCYLYLEISAATLFLCSTKVYSEDSLRSHLKSRRHVLVVPGTAHVVDHDQTRINLQPTLRAYSLLAGGGLGSWG